MFCAGLLVLLLAPQDRFPAGDAPFPDFKKQVDYLARVEQTVRGGLKEDQNAGPLYEKLFPNLGASDIGAASATDAAETLGFCGFHTCPVDETEKDRWPGPWKPAEHPAWERACEKTRPLMLELEKAARKPYYWLKPRFVAEGRIADRMLLNLSLAELSYFRASVRGVIEQSWRSPEGKPDPRALVVACETGLGVAAQCGRYPLAVPRLVSIACRAIVYEHALAALRRDALSQADRTRLAALLDQYPEQPFRLVYEGEAANTYDALQVLNERRLTIADLVPEARQFGPQAVDAPREAARVRQFLKEIDDVLARPYTPAAKDMLAGCHDKLKQEAAASGGRAVTAAVLLAELQRAYQLEQRVRCLAAGTRLTLALLAHRDRTGKWPAALDELPEEVVKRCGTDPLCNRPFVYRLVDGEPMLYSVAQDCNDDGGKHDSKWADKQPGGDYVFWPPPKPGER